jgi:hypothetical protein
LVEEITKCKTGERRRKRINTFVERKAKSERGESVGEKVDRAVEIGTKGKGSESGRKDVIHWEIKI